MFRHYLTTALNALWKYRLFSLINIAGLAIGLASTILIGLFVLDELSYDRQFADAERIYRISRDFPGQDLYLAPNAPLVAPLLKTDFPEIEEAARIFGGQVLLMENRAPVEVTGIIADPPHHTHLDLSVVASMATATQLPIVGEGFLREWGSNNFHTYIKLRPGEHIDKIASQFQAFLARHMQRSDVNWTGMTATPLRDIHLHSTRQEEMKPPGSISNVYLFSAIALFVLLIGCFNFMNLSTARYRQRIDCIVHRMGNGWRYRGKGGKPETGARLEIRITI